MKSRLYLETTIPSYLTSRPGRDLIVAGIEYVVGRAPYASCARGRIIGDTEGFLKLLFRLDNLKLVGVHALGEQATELVHVGLVAMLTGSGAQIFDEACFNIPTLGSLYKTAALAAMKEAEESSW